MKMYSVIIISIIITVILILTSYNVLATDLEDSDIVGYYLDDNGFDFNDESDNALDLTDGSVRTRTNLAKIGYAQQFDEGSGDKLYRAADEAFETTDFCLSGWIYINATRAESQVPFSATIFDGVDYFGWHIQIYKNNHGTNPNKILARTWEGAVSDSDSWISSTALNANTWYHIVYSFNSTDGDATLWINDQVDGAETAEGTGAAAWAAGTSHYLSIGDSITNGVWDGLNFHGVVDEVYYFDIPCHEDNVSFLYNSSNAGRYITPVPAGDITPPVVTLSYPENTTFYNTSYNGSITMNTSENSNCTLNDTNWGVINSEGNQSFHFYRAGTPDGNYSITYRCRDTSDNWNNATFWFGQDTTDPVIYVNNPKNNTIKYSNFTVSVDYYDIYLWRTNTTIKNSSGAVFFNNYSGDLSYGTDWYNVSSLQDINNYTTGNYTMQVEATDTHTTATFTEPLDEVTTPIDDTNVRKIYNLSIGDIWFEYNKDLTITTIIDEDRYKQKLSLDDKSKLTQVDINIRSELPITYLYKSEYPCHFLFTKGMQGYWYDCKGLRDVAVDKINDQWFIIKYNVSGQTDVTTDSLGGLNYITKTYDFQVEEPAPVANGTCLECLNGTICTLDFNENSTGYFLQEYFCNGGDQRMPYIAIVLGLLGTIGILLYLGEKFEFITYTTRDNKQIPFLKYMIQLTSFFMLLVVIDVALQANEAFGMGLIGIKGFYSGMMAITIFTASIFLVGLIYGVLVYMGVLAAKSKK